MKLITHGRMFLMWREREREGGGEREREFGTTGTVSVETEILERVGDGRESDRQTDTKADRQRGTAERQSGEV